MGRDKGRNEPLDTDEPISWDDASASELEAQESKLRSENSQSKEKSISFDPQNTELDGVLDSVTSEVMAWEEERSIESGTPIDRRGWDEAKEAVGQFKPIPWFIWRVSNYVFSTVSGARTISDGMVFGLRKILVTAASDKVLGHNRPVNSTREALKILPPDVAAAVCVIHSICRRLASLENERIWGPILDDAIIRANIGFYVGQMNLDFGPGRGMLAGFAGRVGLAIMIAQGSQKQGYEALSTLANGAQIRDVGEEVYGLDPLKIAAMTLSACGCGKNAAFGTVSYASAEPVGEIENSEQLRWLATFAVIESARMSTLDQVDERLWHTLGYYGEEEKSALHDLVSILVREGHGWHWIK